MTSIKVVHTTNDFRFNGTGHTISTLELILGQVRAGYQVTVICRTSDEEMRQVLNINGVELIETESFNWLKVTAVVRRRSRAALRRSEIVHVHTAKSMLAVRVLAPIVMSRRSVATIHNPHQKATYIMYSARRVVALSTIQARDIARQTMGMLRATPIPNGLVGGYRIPPDIRERVAKSSVDLPEGSILFVGGLYPRKGLDLLLRALPEVTAHCPHAHLFVIGNREYPAIDELVDELGISSFVTFLGYQPAPTDYMARASVFVLPSREEGFGNVLIEARAVGVPIIASNTGGIPSALSGGRAGVLFPVGDVEQLANEIIRVLSDSVYAAELRHKTQLGLEEFSVKHFVEAYQRVYTSLLVRRPVVDEYL